MEKWRLPQLTAEVDRLQLKVEGTGANRRKLRKDYIRVLKEYHKTPIYVVWREEHSNDLKEAIVGFYKNEKEALPVGQELDPTVKISNADGNELARVAYLTGVNGDVNVTRIKFDFIENPKQLYLLLIAEETDEGGTYHSNEFIYFLFETIDEAIEQSLLFFDQEHRRPEEECDREGCQEECDPETREPCRSNLIAELKKKHHAYSGGGRYSVPYSFHIQPVDFVLQ